MGSPAISCLLLVHKNPYQVSRLVSALSAEGTDIYIHVDLDSDLGGFRDELQVVCNPKTVERVHFLRDRIRVRWGGYSIVDATLRLLRASSGRYRVLLSGACYPIKSTDFIRSFFAEDRTNYINCYRLPNLEKDKPTTRITNYYIPIGKTNNFFRRVVNKAIEFIPDRDYKSALSNIQPYAGYMWWALTDEFTEYALSYIDKNPKYNNFFRYTQIPDEMFFFGL